MKKLSVLALICALFALNGCGAAPEAKKEAAAPKKDAKPAVVKVGVTAGPHAEIMDNVKKLAAKKGINIEVVEFNDFVSPNIALNQGDLYADSMQHAPYLAANLKKEPKFELVEVFKTVNFPMAIYSSTIKKGGAIPDGASIAIPNDPSNGGRALLILANANMIELKDKNNPTSSVADITKNPHKYTFKELDAAAIPRNLKDVTCAIINVNYALPAGLSPEKDAILVENPKNNFVNIFVVKKANANDQLVKDLKAIYQSKENADFIKEHFKGTIQPAWN